MKEINRILIIRTDGIGDVLLTLPMAQVLRNKFPNAHIAMLIKSYTAELLEDNLFINQILFYDNGKSFIPFFQLVAKLRSENFDLVFHTYPRFRLALITWLAGIQYRVGTGYRWYSFLFNRRIYEHRKYAEKHELEYNLNLLAAIGCSIDSKKITPPKLEVKQHITDKVKTLLAEHGYRNSQQIVIIHPGSGGSARDWSANNFGVLGQRLSKHKNIKIIITGRQNESHIVNEVKSIIGDSAISFIDQLTLKEYAALSKLSSLLIANSTGPIHVAAAVDTPVIGLYPRIVQLNPKRWAPYTEKKIIFTPHDKPDDCKKCIRGKKRICECMETITVDEVFEAVVNFLKLS